MKIHPLMLAAAIAFWGWQTGQWFAAVAAGALLVSSFYAALRWTFTDAQLYRVADFTTVLALVIGGWLWATQGNPRAVILFFQWLPVLLLPVALAHAWGARARMNLAVLFWGVRRRPLAENQRPALFDPWFPYYALWIVAASAANQRGEWFYVGLAALISWPLVRVRPWTYPVGSWGIAFSAALLAGYGLFQCLNSAQNWLEGAVPEWINAAGTRTDPYRATTDIGHIGKLKESDGIVLRVTVPAGAKPPGLLHRASYNVYSGVTWLARGQGFTRVNGSGERWPLAPDAGGAATQRITVHDHSNRPNPILSLPAGTRMVENLAAIDMQRNGMGAVQITHEPGFFSYSALSTQAGAVESTPDDTDTRVPAREREAFAALADELGLSRLPPAEAVEAVTRWFAQGYRYATFQADAPTVGSPLVDFLHRSKSGHCEYFATATVLLLRAGGIPARYATGFGVVEQSDFEKAWLVRTRHAHAWARAHVNGAWIDVDTTPASWPAAESQASGFFTRVTDAWSWLRFRAARAWAASSDQQRLLAALLVVAPFALWLALRLWRSRTRNQKMQQEQLLTKEFRMGGDSPFYRIEAALAAQGMPRQAHETTSAWLARLPADAVFDRAALAEMAALHGRYRFDPDATSSRLLTQLQEQVERWLAANRAARDTPTPSSTPP